MKYVLPIIIVVSLGLGSAWGDEVKAIEEEREKSLKAFSKYK